MPRIKKNIKKRPMNRKRGYRKKNLNPYRRTIARSIQYANLRPSTALVKFGAREKFLVAGVASANTKSVLQIPLSYLGTPTATSGVWNPDSGFFHVPGAYGEWFPKYQYYKVVGAKITVVVRPAGIGQPDGHQFQCKAFTTLSDSAGIINGTTALDFLEEGRDINEAHWRDGGSTLSGFSSARLRRFYSAKKTHNIKDVKDAGILRTATVFNTIPAAQSYCNVVLCGELDQATTGHPPAIVDVYGTYIVAFQEPTHDNTPAEI